VILDPVAANAFIAGYKALLLQIAGHRSAREGRGVLSVLASARRQLSETPTLLDDALAQMTKRSERVDDQVVRAVRTLQVENWVFLRDTTAYSIFVHPTGESVLGVLGLTDPVRAIVGTTGVVLETGVVRFSGKFVCDGIVSRVVHLGPNYRKSFNSVYRTAKTEGRFSADA
jgi:hypothetical protein